MARLTGPHPRRRSAWLLPFSTSSTYRYDLEFSSTEKQKMDIISSFVSRLLLSWIVDLKVLEKIQCHSENMSIEST